jgi:beta-glucosidase
MCAYNRVNGPRACASDWLLNTVLKRDWRYKGFVMSDWGAVPGLEAATAGLDQQSGEQLDKAVYFGSKLADKAATDKAWAARLADMNRRVLTAIYATGVDKNPVSPGGQWDQAAHSAVAEKAAIAGMVLLRNQNNALPLLRDAKSVAVIGGYADGGVISGGGSSQVQGDGGPVVSRPVLAAGMFAGIMQEQFHRSSPLDAIKARLPQAAMHFRDGRYIADAVEAARRSDVAIVFATEWRTEGLDQPDLSLPDGQDALIAAVAAANPRTIVVLETGGPVAMPWLDKTAAVLEAWYPGARRGSDRQGAVWRGEPRRPPAGHVPGQRRAIAPAQAGWQRHARSRFHGQPADAANHAQGRLQCRGLRRGLSLVRADRGQAAVSVRLWPELHHLCPRRAERGWQDRALYPAQHRQGGGR